MKPKLVLIAVALVALIQMVVYAFHVRSSIELAEQENRYLASDIRSLEQQATQLAREVKRLQLMVAAIPPEFLKGVDDPEAGFMEFLNYINEPLVQERDVRVNLRRSPTFTPTPIPHHESQFGFTFDFADTRDAEHILDFIMHQQRFPVKLATLSLRGGSSDRVTADLLMSLHIPARHTRPLTPLHGAEQ